MLRFSISCFLNYWSLRDQDELVSSSLCFIFPYIHYRFYLILLLVYLIYRVHNCSPLFWITECPIPPHFLLIYAWIQPHLLLRSYWLFFSLLILLSSTLVNHFVVVGLLYGIDLSFAIRSSWFEPQSVPGLVFNDCIELLHLWLQRT